MVGIASRYFAGRIALAVAAATIIGIATGLDGTGHVVMYATVVLGTAAASFTLMASLSLAAGDSDSNDRQHSYSHSALPAYWPIMAALGLGLLMVGLVIDAVFSIAGIGLLLVATVEWTMSAWSERLSADSAANEAQRQRLMRPFEISLFSALGIAVPVVLVSRVFLAASRNAASWIAIGASTAILVFAFVLYGLPQMRRRITATLLVLAAVGLIVAGITSAAIGEREFEPHQSDEEHEEAEQDEAEQEDGTQE